MIVETSGPIDYQETGTGPTVVLVPGSCSTGAVMNSAMIRAKGHIYMPSQSAS